MRYCFRKWECPVMQKKISEKYEDFLGEGHYFISGAKELLEDLSKKYHLYLASNGAVKVQMSRIQVPELKNI